MGKGSQPPSRADRDPGRLEQGLNARKLLSDSDSFACGDGDGERRRLFQRELSDSCFTMPHLPRGSSANGKPGRLLDAAGIARELGVTRGAAEAIMRALPKQTFPGLRKVYITRTDLERLLDEGRERP
jgi:hypothetical protein